MKKILLLYIALVSSLLDAQCVSNDPTDPCCNQLVNIDPHNNRSFMLNNERTDINFNQSNFLEWINPSNPNFLFNKTPGNPPSPLTNSFVQHYSPHYPFFSNYSATGMVDAETGQSVPFSNMHPRYGWQLLHSATNYQPFSTSPLTLADPGFTDGPYFLFYNKYTAALRAMIYPEGFEAVNKLSMRLKFQDKTNYNTNNNKWYASGLFNAYDRMRALDKETVMTDVFAIADNTQNGGNSKAYFGDFELSYDPCVCNTMPVLDFEVYYRDNLKLYAEGRMVAISTPFNQSGTAPYNFGKDFMSSVYAKYKQGSNDDYEVKSGFLVYNKADQLATDFKVTNEALWISRAMGLLGKASALIPPIGIGKSITYSLSGFTSISGIGLMQPNMQSIYNRIEKNKLDIPVGNLLAGAFDHLSGSMNPPSPNVMLIEGQMALRGEITKNVKWPGFKTKTFGHPGSPVNKTIDKTHYPYYNEAPGLFALLKTPEIDFKMSNNHHEQWTQGHNPSLIYRHGRNTGISANLINGSLEYALNPAAEIDMEKTKIYATLEFDLYSYSRYSDQSPMLPRHIFYNDFWGIENGDMIKYAIPNQNLKDYNNFYKDNKINSIVKNTPFRHFTHWYVQEPETILSKSFYVVRSDTIPFSDVMNMVKKSVPNYNTPCSHGTIYEGNYSIFDKESPSETSAKELWENKYKNRLFRNVIQTALVPIENLDKIDFIERFDHLNFISTITGSQICHDQMKALLNPRLKIVANYVFKPNQYGEINTSEQVYTYELKSNFSFLPANEEIPTVASKLNFNEIEKDVNIGTTNYTMATTIYGKNITISGNLSSNGSKVRIIASGAVTVVPPATIDPDIEIIIQDIRNQEELKPVSETFLKSFCSLNNGNYKAREPLNKMAFAAPSKSKSDFTTTFTLQPNPASDFTRLVIDQPVGDRAMVKVYDMVGREVYSQEMLELDKGKTSLEISTQEFHRGIYIVKVIHDELEQSLKLEVTK
jgi:hypothetical protein